MVAKPQNKKSIAERTHDAVIDQANKQVKKLRQKTEIRKANIKIHFGEDETTKFTEKILDEEVTELVLILYKCIFSFQLVIFG